MTDQRQDQPDAQRRETTERQTTDGDQTVTERETTETAINAGDESDAPDEDSLTDPADE